MQLFDRLAKGDDMITAIGEYPAYILFKSRGAKVEFVAPPDGLVATPLVVGAVNKAPHPEAAKLFVDWAMSKRGQAWYQTNPNLYYGSVRTDAPPMPTGVKLSDFKLLYPTDWNEYAAQSRDVPEGMERHARSVSDRSRRNRGAASPRKNWPGTGSPRLPRCWSFTRSSICCRRRFDVGDPQVRPPTAYGFDNFGGLLQLPADPAQHADGLVRGDRDGAGDRLRDGVDSDAHQRAGPRACSSS